MHAVWFTAWILVNTGAIRSIHPFDPFPFSLLTMVGSLEAIFLRIFIPAGENRMTQAADRREELTDLKDVLSAIKSELPSERTDRPASS